MDSVEARQLLLTELQRYRELPYADLCSRVDREPSTTECRGPSGTLYQLEIQVFWDSAERGPVRVLGLVDDGGIRSLVPLPEDFIMAPDGSFVGE